MLQKFGKNLIKKGICMKLSTKYIIEFSTEDVAEVFAICDSISAVKKYLDFKFNFKDISFNDKDGYILIINLDCGKIRVRKIDYVED